jgi:undecaprenyl-diphosphatase
MLGLTNIGRGGFVWAVAAIVRARVRPRLGMAACQVILAVTVAWIIPDAVVKPLTARPRPFAATTQLTTLREHPGSYSFPSGHAATAVAGAYSLAAMWPAARPYAWVLATLITLSRAYLGVHYPTDLLGGALLGWFVGWFVVGRTRWSAARA